MNSVSTLGIDLAKNVKRTLAGAGAARSSAATPAARLSASPLIRAVQTSTVSRTSTRL